MRTYIKFSLYLDAVDADSGAIRLIPGSQFIRQGFSKLVYDVLSDPEQVTEKLGVPLQDVPAAVVVTEPGDVVLWNYKMIHRASTASNVGVTSPSDSVRQRSPNRVSS